MTVHEVWNQSGSVSCLGGSADAASRTPISDMPGWHHGRVAGRQRTSANIIIYLLDGLYGRRFEGGGDPRNVLLDYAEPQNAREWGRGGLHRISVRVVPRVAK